MRHTKHHRRFHTDRIIANRQKAYEREAPSWWWPRHLEDGRLTDRNAYFGCGQPRCLTCHWSKFMEPRRAREKRFWKREVWEEIA